jgi:hypothetical protein
MKWPSGSRMPPLAIIVVLSGVAAAAQAPAHTSIVKVGFEGATCAGAPGANPCAVLIEADGPLPEPSSGSVSSPDRVYLDFPGTLARTSGVPRTSTTGLDIRVALHSESPPVTRVVVDLTAPASYTLDTSHRAEGRVRLQLVTLKATPPAGDVKKGAPAIVATAPARGARLVTRSYVDGMKTALDAFERTRSDLTLLDHRSMPSAESLRNDAIQLSVVRVTLESLKPPAALASSHALLQSACGLASLALDTAAKTPQGNVTPDAASAAAGALIMFDRARAALSSAK